MTSAVRKLWIAEGVKSVDDLACQYTTPRQVCHHMDEHNLDDANIDSEVGVQLEEVQHTQTKAYRALAQPCCEQSSL